MYVLNEHVHAQDGFYGDCYDDLTYLSGYKDNKLYAVERAFMEIM